MNKEYCHWTFLGYTDVNETIPQYYVEFFHDERTKYDDGSYCNHCGKKIKEV